MLGHLVRTYGSACRPATRPVGAAMVAARGPRMPVFAPWTETPVLAALESGVLTLTLNRPQRLNAMNNPP